MKISFYDICEIPDELLKFAVISAKYNGKWIFCRHKLRSTWEIPGGHREIGENILDTAKRELHEETGAVEFDIQALCVYGVTRNEETTYGLLCLAEVKNLEDIPPETEIGEIKLVDSLPKELTYPEIQPSLYQYTQGWLNRQSNPNELWDVYDEHRKLTGRTHRRGEPLNNGDYHLAVQIWIQNSNGEYLLTKRTPNKGFPNMWECTGGSAVTGDDSLTAALREAKEETGLVLFPKNGKRIIELKGSDYYYDIWLFKQDFALKDIVLQENETCGAMLATKEQILMMNENGTLIPCSYLIEFFDMINEKP